MKKFDLPVNYELLKARERKEVREQYIEQQGGLCYFCECDLDGEPHPEIKELSINFKMFPPGFLKNPIHLQHDHDSGMTEGAVHSKCNAVMFQYYGR